MGLDPDIVSEKRRIRPKKSEVGRLRSDNTLALKLAQWKPRIGLDEGLAETIDWLKNNLELYERAKDDYVF